MASSSIMSQVETQTAVTSQELQTATKPESHIEILDALRGIALLLVLGFHFCEGLNGLTRLENMFYGLFRAGWMGVDLFFVLSGFLIIGILVDTKEAPKRMFKFYMRRTLRIFPLYYLALLLIFVVLPLAVPLGAKLHLSGHQNTFGGLIDASARQNQAWFWTYTTNILASIDQSQLGRYGHFWSLAVEEQFYLVCPMLIYHLSLERALTLCRYCIVGAFFIRTVLIIAGASSAANFLMPCRMDALAVGGYIALAWRMGKITPVFIRASRWVALSALALMVALFLARHSRFDATDNVVRSIGYTVIAIFFGALTVLCVMGQQLQWLNQSWLRTFGKYSYAIYLMHRPLHPILFSLLGFSALTVAWKFPMLRLLPFLILAPATCLLLGKISWVFYERRFLTLKKLYSY